MSEAKQNAPAKNLRARPTREQMQFGERRRRSGFDHSNDKRLAVDEALLDQRNYTYRFFNDEPGRIRKFTQYDDWSPVASDEVGGGDVAYPVGVGADGKTLFARLYKKPRIWHQADQNAKIAKSRDEEQELLRRVPQPEGGLDEKGYTTKDLNTVRGGISRIDSPQEQGGLAEADDADA